jgi:hypothetical protein
MKNSAFFLALVCGVVACGGQKNPPKGSNTQVLQNGQKTPGAAKGDSPSKVSLPDFQLPSADVRCPMPEAFVAGEQAGDVIGLLDHLDGKYQLEAVHAYAQKGQMTANGANVGSLYATAKVTKNSESGPLIDLHFECQDVDASSKIEIPIDAASTIYAPSNRVTVFDENTKSDNPEFNFPTLLKVSFDSTGNAFYKNNMGGAPFKTDLTFKELAAKWPKDQKLTMRPDGKDGFQVIYTDPSNQYTRVLLVYARVRK